MNIDRWVLRLSGALILFSVLMSMFFSVYWLWLTAIIGFNLLQSSFSNICPMAITFRIMGGKSRNVFY
ncbi:DUF2892 domain-containing protein [Simiduia litorea]|uniref:YgaP family membrane protein n=1 Tax=Simiduia litorea TaxID=1435348 RepID=UPI0036F25BD9